MEEEDIDLVVVHNYFEVVDNIVLVVVDYIDYQEVMVVHMIDYKY